MNVFYIKFPGVWGILLIMLCHNGMPLWGQVTSGDVLEVKLQGANSACNFTVKAELKPPTCAEIPDGAIRLVIENAIGAVTFQWQNEPATSNAGLANLKAGVYSVIIADTQCKDEYKVELPGPLPLLAPDIDTSFCGRPNFLKLLRNVRGGNSEYRLRQVSTVFGTVFNCVDCTVDSLLVDTTSLYKMSIVDRKGCERTRLASIKLKDTVETFLNIKEENCYKDAVIQVIAEGASGEFYYSLDNGQNLNSDGVFDELRGGNYRVVVIEKEKGGCRIIQNTIVPANLSIGDFTLEVQNASCHRAADGSVAIQLAQDNASQIVGLSINDSTPRPQSNPNFSQLTPGIHKFSIIAADGCIRDTFVNIRQPDPIQLEFLSQTPPDCPGEPEGEVTYLAAGGNGDYSFSLNNSVATVTDTVIRGLTAGDYSLRVQDKNGCTENFAFTLDDPDSLHLGSTVTASCPKDSTGHIIIISSGEILIGEYAYSLDSIHWQRQNTFGNLPPGLYKVLVRTPEGCIYSAEILVPEIPAPGILTSIADPSCSGSNNGSITIEVVPPAETHDFQYSLDSIHYSVNNNFPQLVAGDYALYLLDTNQCVFGYNFELEDPQPMLLSSVITDATCYGVPNGKLSIQVTGGKKPYTYAVDSGNFRADSLFNNLPAGTHNLLVRDQVGCLNISEIAIGQPDSLHLNISVVDATCNNSNGIAACLPSGGVGPYTFKWQTGDSAFLVTGLKSGVYSLMVTDSKRCSKTSQAHVQDIVGPAVFAEYAHVQCHGAGDGFIDLSIVGGTAPYNYLWSTGASTEDLNKLRAGNYLVTVTDGRQCSATKAYTIFEPSGIRTNYQAGQFEGLWFINLIVEGGVQPFQYKWSNGETTQDIFNVPNGTYAVTITDAQNCTANTTISLGTNPSDEPSDSQLFHLFPNPTNDLLNLEVYLKGMQDFAVTVYDIAGRTVIPAQPLLHEKMELSLGHLPAAMYVLKIENPKIRMYKRVMKL